MSQPRIPLAVFLSGGGRTLANLIDQRDHHQLPVDFRLVISSRDSARGLQIAAAAGIPTRVVRKSDFADPISYQSAMFAPCRELHADLVVMAGFLKHVLIPTDFERRVINIHPALLPDFGGPGMYGEHVHAAVLESGARQSGCTVHFVDDQYDHGPIILQRRCEVLAADTPQTLAARVFARECEALPEAIRELAGRRVNQATE